MKASAILQIHLKSELQAEIDAVLLRGETLTEFVEMALRNAAARRRAQADFGERAQAASERCHLTGEAVPVEAVLTELQAMLEKKRQAIVAKKRETD